MFVARIAHRVLAFVSTLLGSLRSVLQTPGTKVTHGARLRERKAYVCSASPQFIKQKNGFMIAHCSPPFFHRFVQLEMEPTLSQSILHSTKIYKPKLRFVHCLSSHDALKYGCLLARSEATWRRTLTSCFGRLVHD